MKVNRKMKTQKKLLSNNGIQVDWKVIESYFQNKHLERMVRHQIESYDHFVNNQIKKTIEMFNPVTIRSDNDKDEETGL